ncbi:MAG: FkbM family methyltransferase [bacterium]
MFNKLLKEYKRFIKKQYCQLFGNYDFLPFLCDWFDDWKKYHIKNQYTIQEKLDKLKKNMDQQSKDTVDLIYNRYVFINPWFAERDNFLINLDKLFTEKELVQQKEKFFVDKNKFKLPKGFAHALPIYKYDAGLSFLDSKILKQIEGKDIIDGGAFIGDTAIVFNKYSPSKIYCFEPNEENFINLQITSKLNKLEDKIVPVQKGLGENVNELKLFGEGAGASLINNNDNYTTISVTDIDNFVFINDIKPALIKLDVEGFELETIKGALKTIKTFKPILLISLYHQPKDFFDIKPLIESLELKYNFMVRKIDPNHTTVETILIGYTEEEEEDDDDDE